MEHIWITICRLAVSRLAVKWLLSLIAIVYLGVAVVSAQGVIPGIINGEGDIQINADQLTVDTKKNFAFFSGGVDVRRGEAQLTAGKLWVYYLNNTGAEVDKPNNQRDWQSQNAIKKLIAKGNINFSSQGQTVSGDEGVFSADSNTVVVTGNVTLMQGDNLIRGDKLIFNLDTGEAQIIATPSSDLKGRVSGTFKQNPAPPGQNNK